MLKSQAEVQTDLQKLFERSQDWRMPSVINSVFVRRDVRKLVDQGVAAVMKPSNDRIYTEVLHHLHTCGSTRRCSDEAVQRSHLHRGASSPAHL